MTQSIHQALLLFLCLLTFLTPSLGQQYQAGDIYPHFGTNGKLRIFEAEGNLNP